MVEPYTTFTVPTELVERADRASGAALDVMVAAPRLECAEYRRRLAQARSELAEAYRELCLYVAESGGLVFGLHRAADQLDKQARHTWHCRTCEARQGGDRG